MSVTDMLESRDWQSIAEWLERKLQVHVDPLRLKQHCQDKEMFPARDYDGYPSPEDDIRMWFKNRLAEMGYFQPGCSADTMIADVATAVLHIFFIALEETEEMLARLPEQTKQEAKVATSKITRTEQVIAPIDRVAARVVPVD